MQFVFAEGEDLVGRIFVQCLARPELHDRLVGPALPGKREREVVVRRVIPRGNAQRIAPQGFVVVPVAQLAISETSQNEQYGYGGASQPNPAVSALGGRLTDAPHDCDKQTYEGKIPVAVGHRLLTNRDNSDHRD